MELSEKYVHQDKKTNSFTSFLYEINMDLSRRYALYICISRSDLHKINMEPSEKYAFRNAKIFFKDGNIPYIKINLDVEYKFSYFFRSVKDLVV